MKAEELQYALNLAQAEIRSCYKRLGISGSNVLNIVDKALESTRNGRSTCCNRDLIHFGTYGYDECSECGKTYRHKQPQNS